MPPRPQIAALAPELGVIVAYGGLVREPLLSSPDARLDQPALLPAAALARRRARCSMRCIAGRRRDGRERLPARRRTRRGRRLRRARATRCRAGADGGRRPGRISRTSAPTLLRRCRRRHRRRHGRRDAADGRAHVRAEAHARRRPRRVGRAGRAGARPYPRHDPRAGRLHDGQRHAREGPRRRPAPAGARRRAPGEFALDGGRVFVGTATYAIALDRVQPAGRKAMASRRLVAGPAQPRHVVADA